MGFLIGDVDAESLDAENITDVFYRRSKIVWECPECGRLAMQCDSGAIFWYAPEEGKYNGICQTGVTGDEYLRNLRVLGR